MAPLCRNCHDNQRVSATTALRDVQMNCCGASGPDDYRNSAWFNRSRPVEEVFVPSSCCVSDAHASNVGGRRRDALPLLPRPSESHDQDSCQLNAILFPNNDKLSRSLRTQVSDTAQMTSFWWCRPRRCRLELGRYIESTAIYSRYRYIGIVSRLALQISFFDMSPSISAIAKRPCCRVGYLWLEVEDWNWETVFTDIIGLSSTTVT